jgi:hypothetical protein
MSYVTSMRGTIKIETTVCSQTLIYLWIDVYVPERKIHEK